MRTIDTTRTIDTAPRLMTSASEAIAAAISHPEAFTSNKGRVIVLKPETYAMIKTEPARKNNPFGEPGIGMAPAGQRKNRRSARRQRLIDHFEDVA